MEQRLLLTRSRHDIANQYLYAYSEEILDDAQKAGWKVDRVEDGKCVETELDSRLSKNKPVFVFFNGHGSNVSIHGNNNEKLVDDKSASKLAGTIVFARSCAALNGLGKAAVKDGCRAFIGYSGSFIVPHINELESTPLRDQTAKPVLEVSNLVGKHILKGDTVQNSIGAAQSKASDTILKMLVSSEPYDGATFRALYQNSAFLGFVGDPNAKI
ncbi:MAG: hypothetical protein NTX79_02910 [Candidatus Micrarchaeota archaeon]|nr:hypothetical protein [Candidatus Micrarchaeota archaeon]